MLNEMNNLNVMYLFKVLAAIKRFWCMRKHAQNGTAGNINPHSTSSQGPPSMGDTLTHTTVFPNGNLKSPPLETTC